MPGPPPSAPVPPKRLSLVAQTAQSLRQGIESGHWQTVLRNLIEEHRAETGSSFATELLTQWDVELRNFWQVVPKEMVDRLPHPLKEERAAAE